MPPSNNKKRKASTTHEPVADKKSKQATVESLEEDGEMELEEDAQFSEPEEVDNQQFMEELMEQQQQNDDDGQKNKRLRRFDIR